MKRGGHSKVKSLKEVPNAHTKSRIVTVFFYYYSKQSITYSSNWDETIELVTIENHGQILVQHTGRVLKKKIM